MTSPAITSRWNSLNQQSDFSSTGGPKTPRRLQKRYAENMPPSKQLTEPDPKRASIDPRSSFVNRRRSTAQERRAPLGPRPPQYSPSKRIISDSPAVVKTSQPNNYFPTPISEPFLGLSGRRITSNSDLRPDSMANGGASNGSEDNKMLASHSVLQEPRLEDFPQPGGNHSHVSSSNGLQPSTQFRIPSQSENLSLGQNLPKSVARKPSTSPVRQRNPALRAAQLSSNPASGVATSTPLTIRTRRQSQMSPQDLYGAGARQPRKSVGPGLATSNRLVRASIDQTPHLNNSSGPPNTPFNISRKTSNASSKRKSNMGSTPVACADKDGATQPKRTPRDPFTSQNLKPQQGHFTSSTLIPDGAGLPCLGDSDAYSPARMPTVPNVTPSSSAKRQSVASGHVGGLGARTVSPTDARKSRRISISNRAPPMPARSPTPELTFGQRPPPTPPPARQKSSTPSSSRATPEFNHRLSSGRSVSSRSSYSSLRPSSISMPPVPPNLLLNNRGPMSKPRNAQSSVLGEGKETVPPVPAIPKAYESPSESIDKPFFSDLGAAANGQKQVPHEPQYNQTGTGSGGILGDFSFDFWDEHPSRRLTLAAPTESNKTSSIAGVNRQQAPNPRLPPLNLVPLSTPTAAKIAAFSQQPNEPEIGSVTPPAPRNAAKTPSTPMTASKATFSGIDMHHPFDINSFSRLRSSTSHGNQRSGVSTLAESGNPSPTLLGSASPATPATPYLDPSPTNVSVPPKQKIESSHIFSRGRKEGGKETPSSDQRRSKSMSRRPSTASRSTKESIKVSTSSQNEQDSQPQGSSLRRKLSLGWRRSSSKASISSQHVEEEHNGSVTHVTDMPPPKIPASATNKSFPKSPKPSASPWSSKPSESLENLTSELPGPNGKKPGKIVGGATGQGSSTHKHASSIFSPVQRILSSKNSQANLKHQRSETNLDLDDVAAEEEMKKLGSKKKEFEAAARELEDIKGRAKPKERVSPAEAARLAYLNIFERGEIIDHNDVYFCGAKNAKKFVGDLNAEASNFGFDDERGDYTIVIGDHLAYRYEVVDLLGKGSFGQVVRCIDHKTGGLVAIKIIRNKKRFHQQALVEVKILQQLREWDPKNAHSMINFTHSFYFRGHLCIATELLGINLYEFIKAHDFTGFSLKLIRRFTKQILASLCLLEQHNVIHCDMKPENILLAHPLHSEIKVIDFGSSCFDNERVYTYIQSRFYRSPEVILGMNYGMPIDMWSLGCILAELLTGYPIFPGENEQEQLACIMEVFGPPEKHLIEKSTRRKLFFDSLGKPRIAVSSKGKRRRPSSKTLAQAIKCDDETFVDFIAKCLRWDPDRRMKPHEAMSHDFVTGAKKNTRTRSQFLSSGNLASPAKRSNTVQTPSAKPRALPETPATSYKNGVPSSARNIPSSSPVKGATVARRKSNMYEQGASARDNKRMSSGAALGSALPRAAMNQRSTSGKPDLASAAAIASLNGSNKSRTAGNG